MTYILPTQKDAASNLGRLNPFAGIGKPGPLKHVGAGAWSRRIDNTHRLVF
jgi:Txe/YoeB family toxin of toxin-antitoxin system